MAGPNTVNLADGALRGAASKSPALVSRRGAWFVARLLAPLVVVVGLFLFRREIVDLIESWSGLGFVFTVVHVYSTVGSRLVVGAFAFILLAAIGWASIRFLPRRVQAIVFVAVCATLFSATLLYMGRGAKAAVTAGSLGGLLVMANSIGSEHWRTLLAHPRYGRFVNAFFWLLVGIEFLLPRAFLIWARQRTGRGKSGKPRTSLHPLLPGAAVAAAAFAVLAPFPMLMRLGQALYMSPQATIVFGPDYHEYSKYDVSSFARNPATGDVFLCGQEQYSPKVLRAGGGLIDTGIHNGGNEYCVFAGPRDLATVNKDAHDLLVIDTVDFGLRAQLHLARLPHGEIFLAPLPTLNLLAIASEDEEGRGGGPAIRIVDLGHMKVIREIDAEVGSILADPRRPIIYANHFAMNVGVRAWDVRTGELVATSSRFGRSDRMAFDSARNELLVTVPEMGEIWRLDATTLRDKSPIRTVFGARGLAIDPARNLLLVSSFLTNDLDVIDLKTGRSLRRYRLGPWLRDVLIVSEDGVAFVASRYGVYRVNYLR